MKGIMRVLGVVMVLVISSFVGIQLIQEEIITDAYTEHNIGEASTNVLTMNFDEDFTDEDNEIIYEPEYTYNYDDYDDVTNDNMNIVYDLSNNENDGFLDASPSEQFNEEANFDHGNHDIPKRTHRSTYGRAIDFWVPYQSETYSISDCRYVRIPDDDSLELSHPEGGNYNYYDFELYCWPHKDENLAYQQVLLNNLWEDIDYQQSNYEGWYRIIIDQDGKLAFQYTYRLLSIYYIDTYTSSITIKENKWNRINIRLILGSSGSNIQFYLNGSLLDQGSLQYNPSFNTPSPSRYFTIGADPYSESYVWNIPRRQFYGILDEIRINKGTTTDEWASDAESIGRQLFFIDFDEQGGNYIIDQTKNDMDGMVYPLDDNSKWGSDGIYGGYLHCPNNNSYYGNIPDNDELHVQELTLGAWIKPVERFWEPVDDHTNIISKAYNSQSQPYYSFYLKITRQRNIVFGIGADNPDGECAVTSSNPVPFGEWTHIAGTFKNGVTKIYVNQELDNSATHSWTNRNVVYNSNAVRIGHYQYRDHLKFPGDIDQVGMYNYSKEYQPEITRFEFEEGSGSIADDWTPYENNGALEGNAQFTSDGSGKYGDCVDLSSDYTNPRVNITLSHTGSDYIDEEFTVDIWVKPESTLSGPSVIASQYNAWELGMDSNKLPYFKVKETGGNWITAKHILPIIGDYNDDGDYNTWHHLMGVYKAEEIFIFLDGKSGYGDQSNDATHSFSSYTRQTSTNDVFLGVRYDGSQYYDQYYGLIDSFRLRKGVYDLTEDVDGDGMSDKYEIIRSLHSDQYDPFEHNSRFALLVAGKSISTDSNIWVFEDRLFRIVTYDTYNLLKQQGYDDNDIIYLDNSYIYEEGGVQIQWDLSFHYEDGDWIDGDSTIDNIRDTFDILTQGGKYILESSEDDGSGNFDTNERIVPKLDDSDFFFWQSLSHGSPGGNLNLTQQTQSCPIYSTTSYTATNFKNDLDSINNKYSAVVVEACHSGDLTLPPNDIIKNNRVVITSSSPGQQSEQCHLYFSSRIYGNSSSYNEWYCGFWDPSNYPPSDDLLKLIKWMYNADDILENSWSLPGSNDHLDVTYKERNTRNIVVSFQEAYYFALMWHDILNMYDNGSLGYGGPKMDEGDDVPDHLVL